MDSSPLPRLPEPLVLVLNTLDLSDSIPLESFSYIDRNRSEMPSYCGILSPSIVTRKASPAVKKLGMICEWIEMPNLSSASTRVSPFRSAVLAVMHSCIRSSVQSPAMTVS